VWDSLSELHSFLRQRRLERTVLMSALLPVKTAHFTQFFRQVWRHTVKSLSLTESVERCSDINTQHSHTRNQSPIQTSVPVVIGWSDSYCHFKIYRLHTHTFHHRRSKSPLCTGGWVGPRTVLDRCGKSHPHRDSIPGPPARSQSL
jgi:hypothetical protein